MRTVVGASEDGGPPRWPTTKRTRTPVGDLVKVWIRYVRKHGRFPRLLDPRSYNEKVQWRKLFDFNPLFACLSDKRAVREFITARIGHDRLVPLLWSGERPEDIPLDRLHEPYVVKCTHGHAMNLFVDDPRSVDRRQVVAQARRWMGHDHGRGMVEPGHIDLEPWIIVEKMMRRSDGRPPTEYKFFLFDGRIALIAIRLNEDHHVHSNLFITPEWTPTPLRFDMPRFEGETPGQPVFYDEMAAVAERIGAGFDHIRVDFLAVDDGYWAGELSLYPHSGMVPAEPDDYDRWLGRQWRLDEPRRRAFASLLGRPHRAA